MANRSKQKGDREERDVVNTFRTHGFECRRTLEAGARSDGSVTHDIDLLVTGYPFGIDGWLMRGECKVRANGFKTIYGWFEAAKSDDDKRGLDFLTIRANNQKRLVVMEEDTFIDLIKR